MKVAKLNNINLLIESTCNQVNQNGGYTGFTPLNFVRYCRNLAEEIGFNSEKLTLGGDHLGPSVWQKANSKEAMIQAKQLVKQYALAGYEKFHLDASMPCADDETPFSEEIVSNRQADLCKVIESCYCSAHKVSSMPFYVLGTEVPIPGGATLSNESTQVSSVKDTERNIELTRKSFKICGLEKAWERTIAFVVQPGVEFGDNWINKYDHCKANNLSRLIENYENLVYEAHSTDYQNRFSLREMVIDHFSILKVGPSLTFALREGIFALAYIEEEIASTAKFEKSNFFEVYESVLLQKPEYWKNHYLGTKEDQRF